jgi:hypothetical protein
MGSESSLLYSQSPPLIPILSQMNPVHTFPSQFLKKRFMLSSDIYYVLLLVFFLWVFPSKCCVRFFPFVVHTPSISSPLLGKPNNIWRGVLITELLILQVSPASYYTISFRSKYSPPHPILKYPLSVCSLNVADTFSYLYYYYILYPVRNAFRGASSDSEVDCHVITIKLIIDYYYY